MGKKIRAPKGDVTVKVDPKLKKEYDALVSVIATASRKESEDFDARWEAAAKIVDHQLYVLGGYENAEAFFREVMQEEPRNARRYLRVAKYASPAEETKYGTSKLDAALGFVEAKLGHPLDYAPLPVAFDKLRVPVGKGTKSLEAASVPEITAATSKLVAQEAEDAGAERARGSDRQDRFAEGRARARARGAPLVHRRAARGDSPLRARARGREAAEVSDQRR